MSRKKGNPLEGKTQAEIDTIMSKRVKNMNEEELRVYKRVKYNAWILKNPDRAPKSKKAKKSTKKYEPIEFVQKSEKDNENKELEEDKKVESSKSKMIVSNGKIPRWAVVEELNDKQKEWSENRQVLISFNGEIKICRMNWIGNDEMPTITCKEVEPFFLSWPIAYCAARYAFVRSYERDAILKNNT
jgi:hypothetical protein